jgi:hypothetical protein
LVIGGSLQREEGLQELLHRVRPSGAMVSAGESKGEGGGMLEPGRAEAEEVGATDAQELGGTVWIEVAVVEGFECLLEEAECEACCELVFCMVALSARPARRTRPFVGRPGGAPSTRRWGGGAGLIPAGGGKKRDNF